LRQADSLIHRLHYDLTKTFDVLVGKEPNQQRFTVHHDLLVQRSEFFKAARSSRWTQADRPTNLEDHDPETFSTYLHCLYFGADAIKDRLSVIGEQHGSTNETTSNCDESSHSGNTAGNDVLVNGEGTSNSESNSDSEPDGAAANDKGQNKQQSMEGPTPKSPRKLTAVVDGKEKEATATLFVGNLSWTTEEKTLEQAFAEFGELRGVRIVTSSKDGHSRGFGYVEFISAESAVKALQVRTGFELDGRSLRLDFSKPRSGTVNVPNQDQLIGKAQEQSINKHDVSVDEADSDTNEVGTVQPAQGEVATIDYNTNYNEKADDVDDAKIRALIKLYVLADKLIDPQTANLVIDALVGHVDALPYLPGTVFVNIVYRCTPTGSPLRALFRDWNIHELNYTAYQAHFDENVDLPVEYLKDLMVEIGRIRGGNDDERIGRALKSKPFGRPTGHYHQKAGSSQGNSGK
jgi:RNA recognition motif-containing protein